MNDRGQDPSKRFQPSTWTERLVPVLLIALLLVLVATIALVLVSVFGMTVGI